MADAVVLLVHPCQLVLLDYAREIILAACGGDQTGLAVLAHDLAIEIETGLCVLPKGALGDKPLEILCSPAIDLRRINIGGRRQANFRLADVKEAEGIPPGNLSSLV